MAIEVERAISGHGVVRVMERLALSRGLPRIIRTDNGKEFCGKAMLEWAHRKGVLLRVQRTQVCLDAAHLGYNSPIPVGTPVRGQHFGVYSGRS